VSVLLVPPRFRGPATSGNGGWTSGSLAALLAGTADAPQPAVRVRLSAPPPLQTPMTVATTDGQATAALDGRTVLTADLIDDEAASALAPVPPVPFEVALAAGVRYAGLADHPFPECFACGTGRAPGDGLRLQPGSVGTGQVAAAWVPDVGVGDDAGRVPVPVVWAALDCPSGWSVDIVGRPMVLGTMTARVDERPRVGEALVVVGRAVDVSDRKALTASTLRRSTGEVLAVAEHVWIAVDPAAFGRREPA
jgi:hypothetical protein